MTLGHTFSYIVSLPVSENVSGVAILAAFCRKCVTGINTRTNLGTHAWPVFTFLDESSTYPNGQRRLRMNPSQRHLSLQSAGTQLAYRVAQVAIVVLALFSHCTIVLH